MKKKKQNKICIQKYGDTSNSVTWHSLQVSSGAFSLSVEILLRSCTAPPEINSWQVQCNPLRHIFQPSPICTSGTLYYVRHKDQMCPGGFMRVSKCLHQPAFYRWPKTATYASNDQFVYHCQGPTQFFRAIFFTGKFFLRQMGAVVYESSNNLVFRVRAFWQNRNMFPLKFGYLQKATL